MSEKPLNRKTYGSIPHLPCSRMGPADHACHEGQARIATEKKRDKHDTVIVQEKLDGSCVGVARINGELVALQRAGYRAETSPYPMHKAFAEYVKANQDRFDEVLENGGRVVGEWLHTAHGTMYDLPHEPFVLFDIFGADGNRKTYEEVVFLNHGEGCVNEDEGIFVLPAKINTRENNPLSVEDAMESLSFTEWLSHGIYYGYHGATEPAEGAVWRVERKGKVDFLVKYVRPDKEDGKYLFGEQPILNKWLET